MVELLNAPAQQNIDNKGGTTPNATENYTPSNDQLRTIAGKKKMLHLLKGYTSIAAACRQIGIERSTYYMWYRNDPEFRVAVRQLLAMEADMVEDLLREKIFKDKETASIHLYLKSNHPNYRPHLKIEPVGGNRSFEDIIDIEDGNITDATIKETTQTEQPEDRGTLLDTQQEGAQSEVQAEQGPIILPGETEKKEHNNQSEAEGAK